MADIQPDDLDKFLSDSVFNGWTTSGFTHLTDLGLAPSEFHLIPNYMNMTARDVGRDFARNVSEAGEPVPKLDRKIVRDFIVLNAGWVAAYTVPDKVKAFVLASMAYAAENGLYDVVDRKEFTPAAVGTLRAEYKSLAEAALKVPIARATMLWWSKTYNVWNTRHTLPEFTDAMARYIAVATETDIDLINAHRSAMKKLMYQVMHPWDERLLLMFHPAGERSHFGHAKAAVSGNGIMGTKRDRYLDLRAYTLPEGTHRVALALVFYSDLVTSGAVAVMPTDTIKTLDTAILHSEMIAKDPMAFHSNAQFWGVHANQLDMTGYDELFPWMNSYYTVTRTRPSMLNNPRVKSAGRAARHEDLVAVHEASRPKIEMPVKAITISPETLEAQAAKIGRALALLRQ
jgi:hypothetical protein